MPWHRVVISYLDQTARNTAGNALIEKFGALYRKSGAPSDVEVFKRSYDEAHVFYFSPKAAEIGRDLLSAFSSQPCAEEPDRVDFCKIVL
jgi:hypothetical protein